MSDPHFIQDPLVVGTTTHDGASQLQVVGQTKLGTDNGVVKLTNGVVGIAVGGTDYATAGHTHAGVYEPADGTILKTGAIGVSVASQTDLMNVINSLAVAGAGGAETQWNLAISGGTPELPTTFIYTNRDDANLKVRQIITYNGNGDPSSVTYEKSTNGGGLYTATGTKTFTYDGSFNVTAITWS